jgi:hypothetical protein
MILFNIQKNRTWTSIGIYNNFRSRVMTRTNIWSWSWVEIGDYVRAHAWSDIRDK